MTRRSIVATQAVVMGTALTVGLSLGCSSSTPRPEPKTAQAATAYPEQTAPTEPAHPTPQASAWQEASASEQATVENAAATLERIESNPAFAQLDSALRRARGVMIFPHASKGDLVAGGAGANGVLVGRNAEGRWSAPAFYTLSPGADGLRIGFDHATIVLVFMSDAALKSAIHQRVDLTTNARVGPGIMGTDFIDPSRDIYTFVSAEKVFLGVNLEGAKLTPQLDSNQHYYGDRNATTAGVVLDRRFDRVGTNVLKEALARVS